MKAIYNLIIKDLIRFLNDKPAVLLTFVVPMALIVIFGNIFGGSGPRGKVGIILVNESSTPVSRIIETKLDTAQSLRIIKKYLPDDGKDSLKFTEDIAKEYVRTGKISAAVVMPKDFFADTSGSLKFKFYYDPKNEIESSIIQGQMQQAIMSGVPRLMPVLMTRRAVNFIGSDSTTMFIRNISSLLEKYFDLSADSLMRSFTQVDTAALMDSSLQPDSSGGTQMLGSLIRFESEQLVGAQVANPGLTRTVGGWAMMFLLFSLTGAATSLFEEKQEGTLKRLLCMPLNRSHILWSKYIYTMLLGMVQLFVLFVFSWVLFKVDVFSNLFNLFIVIFASSAAAVSFGMLITSLAKTINQANGISTLVILVMSAIGGSWFPVTLLPEWMQTISRGTLTYWSVEAFLQVLWRQSNFAGIANHVAILLSIAFLINFYSLIRFRNGEVF